MNGSITLMQLSGSKLHRSLDQGRSWTAVIPSALTVDKLYQYVVLTRVHEPKRAPEAAPSLPTTTSIISDSLIYFSETQQPSLPWSHRQEYQSMVLGSRFQDTKDTEGTGDGPEVPRTPSLPQLTTCLAFHRQSLLLLKYSFSGSLEKLSRSSVRRVDSRCVPSAGFVTALCLDLSNQIQGVSQVQN